MVSFPRPKKNMEEKYVTLTTVRLVSARMRSFKQMETYFVLQFAAILAYQITPSTCLKQEGWSYKLKC